MSDIYLLIVIALLCIFIVVVYSYFTSKISKQNEHFLDISQGIKDREVNQNALLASISDDIYRLTQNLLEPHKENKPVSVIENEILNSAGNLRELLKIKSNKVRIYSEKFNFSHMLGDISLHLASSFRDVNTEVVFDIDSNMPVHLYGDVLHFSRIVNNILEFSIRATPYGKVVLKVSCQKPINNEIVMNVQISDTSEGMNAEECHTLFDLSYDEETNKHTGLRLHIAKKLTRVIGGTIEVESERGAGNTFDLVVPMEVDTSLYVKDHSVFKKEYGNKRVLIFSEKPATGTSLENLFSPFYKEVVIVGNEEVDQRKINFADYDILVLDDIYFNPINNKYLASIKQNNKMDIVAFNSIFLENVEEGNELIDVHLEMPSNLARIDELTDNLAAQEEESVDSTSVLDPDGKLPVCRESIEETGNITVENFSHFKGSRLLIVEDNLINQKILMSVLKKSGMEIDIANHGQEALDLLFIEKKKYDIVLMDISMPVMDGLIATQHIRQNQAFNLLPIITFTAFAMGAEIEQMFEAKVNAYLTKPLNIKKLYTVFNMFLGNIHRKVSLKKAIEIEGLDIEQGIAWADESEVLYKETLKEFVSVYKDTADFVPKWIKEERYDLVKGTCTEMQGILGMMGAYEMKEIVDSMQKNFLYSNELFLDKYTVIYPEKLKKLMLAIEQYLRT